MGLCYLAVTRFVVIGQSISLPCYKDGQLYTSAAVLFSYRSAVAEAFVQEAQGEDAGYGQDCAEGGVLRHEDADHDEGEVGQYHGAGEPEIAGEV